MQSKIARTACLVAAACAVTVAGTASAQTQTAVHLDAANRNLGGVALLQTAHDFYCNLPMDNNQIVIDARNVNSIRIPLTQVYDNVWWVGSRYVGAYLIKDSDGIVMIDTGNTATEVQTYTVPALQAIGMSASYPLKAIFITHGHGDHDGGALYLKQTYGVPIYLGSADRTLQAPNGKAYNPTYIDSTDHSVRELSVGGHTFTIMPTPGHTPGTTTSVVTVKDGGQDIRILVPAGSSMTNSIADVTNYLDSEERIWALARATHPDGLMHPHNYWDGTRAFLDQMQVTGKSTPSQFAYGYDNILRVIAVARECTASWLTRLDTTRVVPSWRFNEIKFVGGAPTVNNVQAQVTNGWGPLANQKVTFTSSAGASCTAATDDNGVASCAVHPLRPFKDTLTASFAGAQSADFVDLPADTAPTTVCSNGTCK